MQSVLVGYPNYSQLTKFTNQLTKTLYGNTEQKHSLLNILFTFSVNIFYEILHEEFQPPKNDWFPKIKQLRNSELMEEFKNSVFRLRGLLKDR